MQANRNGDKRARKQLLFGHFCINFTYLRSQTKHLNGFSPEWIRRWAVRLAS